MSKYLRRLDEQHQVIKTLWIIVSVLVSLLLIVSLGWKSSSKALQIYVTPSMLASGGYVKPGEVPDSEVYSFAFQIFSAINVWEENGEANYHENLSQYRNYLTSRFLQQLLLDVDARKQNGEIKRIRLMSIHRGFETADVKPLGRGIWEVHLLMRLTERLDAESIVSKDVLMDYHLRVVQVNISKAKNPFGLMLDGYSKPEKRIKTFV